MERRPSKLLKQWLNVLNIENVVKIQERLHPVAEALFNVERVTVQAELQHELATLTLKKKEMEDDYYTLDNGYIFEGKLSEDGQKQGPARVTWFDNASHVNARVSLSGYFHKDLLVGTVIRRTPVESKCESKTNKVELYFCKRGVRHGVYASWTGEHLSTYGVYLNGLKSGFWWTGIEGGSYFCHNHQVQDNQQVGAFIYPDLYTSLVGEFDNNCAISKVKAATVENVSIDKFGVMRPIFEDEVGIIDTYCGETDAILAKVSICSQPLLADPFESRYVEVRSSSIPNAGEGLFAKENIPAGRLLAFFNGCIALPNEDHLDQSDWDYAIGYRGESMLNIPRECRSTNVYRATLGHKICHSFQPNAIYSYAYHPRFAKILRSAVSIKDINAGEEITCDYKYSLHKAPKWYINSLREYLKDNSNLSEEGIGITLKHVDLAQSLKRDVING